MTNDGRIGQLRRPKPHAMDMPGDMPFRRSTISCRPWACRLDRFAMVTCAPRLQREVLEIFYAPERIAEHSHYPFRTGAFLSALTWRCRVIITVTVQSREVPNGTKCATRIESADTHCCDHSLVRAGGKAARAGPNPRVRQGDLAYIDAYESRSCFGGCRSQVLSSTEWSLACLCLPSVGLK